MQASNPEVNMVSAPIIAKERGIKVSTTTQAKSGVFDAYIKLTVVTDERERSIAGTVFSDGKPRFIQIKGINIDAEIGRHMLYTTNEDVPGIIGTLGQTLGQNGVNIANFTLGRSRPRQGRHRGALRGRRSPGGRACETAGDRAFHPSAPARVRRGLT